MDDGGSGAISNDIFVCGTLNIDAGFGTVDFENKDITINNGGVLNLNSGTLEVDVITVKNGGTINLNGGTLRRACGSSTAAYGLIVEEGGRIEVLDGSSRLIAYSCLSEYTLMDGTFDCNDHLTSFNRGNFQLGKVNTTNDQSTGRFRTQTAFLPLVEIPRAFDANFFGRNSTWGGTVEYYGGGTISLPTLDTRWTYFDLEVNNTNLNLGTIPYVDVVGNVYLDGGYIDINDSQLQLRGSVVYRSGGYIRTRPT